MTAPVTEDPHARFPTTSPGTPTPTFAATTTAIAGLRSRLSRAGALGHPAVRCELRKLDELVLSQLDQAGHTPGRHRSPVSDLQLAGLPAGRPPASRFQAPLRLEHSAHGGSVPNEVVLTLRSPAIAGRRATAAWKPRPLPGHIVARSALLPRVHRPPPADAERALVALVRCAVPITDGCPRAGRALRA